MTRMSYDCTPLFYLQVLEICKSEGLHAAMTLACTGNAYNSKKEQPAILPNRKEIAQAVLKINFDSTQQSHAAPSASSNATLHMLFSLKTLHLHATHH